MVEQVDYPDWERGVRIVGSDITLQVNIEAITATLNIIFSDQSVAVFDAAKWFAHQAQQIFVTGTVTVDEDGWTLMCDRLVPENREFYINGLTYGLLSTLGVPTHMWAALWKDPAAIVATGSYIGDNLIFDVPLRVIAGETIELLVGQYGAGGTRICHGSFWGYDEVV